MTDLTPAELVALLTCASLLTWLVTFLFHTFRKVSHFMDDVSGEPARPGRHAQPGVMERLEQQQAAAAELQRLVLTHLEDVVELLAALREQGLTVPDMHTPKDEHV